jgi:MFS family permease
MRVLPLIVVAQFLCTTLWFVGNAVMPEVLAAFGFNELFFAYQTGAVQLGFISGTFLFALLTLADRFSPTRVFFLCAFGGAIVNLGILSDANGFTSILLLRFLTGFFLAGIYPVGMKIAADHFDKGLGKSLGYLVGALVLGTAFPHLLRGYLTQLPWRSIVMTSSALAVLGGILMLVFVPNGPYRKVSGKMEPGVSYRVFENINFRSAAFGYFGHMWELYTFWAFVPLMLTSYISLHPGVEWNIGWVSFIIIGSGGLACILAGHLAARFGARRIAAVALALSGGCCLLSPFVFAQGSPTMYLLFLVFWGIAVVGDSPMFSTLVAQHALPEHRGTALTIVNCLGFFITIVSLLTIGRFSNMISIQYLFLLLALGPGLGLIALLKGRETETSPLTKT